MSELEEIKDILYTFSIKEALISVNYNDLNYVVKNAEDIDKRAKLKQEDINKLYIETYNEFKKLKQSQPLQLREEEYKDILEIALDLSCNALHKAELELNNRTPNKSMYPIENEKSYFIADAKQKLAEIHKATSKE